MHNVLDADPHPMQFYGALLSSLVVTRGAEWQGSLDIPTLHMCDKCTAATRYVLKLFEG